MCEKPMAVSAAEAEAMIAACNTAGKKLMIGYRSSSNNIIAMRSIWSSSARSERRAW